MPNKTKFTVTSNTDNIDNLKNIVPLSLNEDKQKLYGIATTIADTMNHPEYKKYIYSDLKYRICFIKKEEFRGKRFLKFVKKVENQLYNVLSSIMHTEVRGKITLEDFIVYSVFYEIGLNLEGIHLDYDPNDYDVNMGEYINYPEELSYTESIGHDVIELFRRIKEIREDNPDAYEPSEIIELLKLKGLYKLSDEDLLSLVSTFDIQKYYEYIKTLVYPELYNIIEEHLRGIYVFCKDACEANYHQYLPDEEETFLIFIELMTRIFIDANNYMTTNVFNNGISYKTQKLYAETYNKYMDKLAEKDAKIKELQDELAKQPNNKSTKKENISAVPPTNDITNKLKEELRLSRKENEKLNKKLDEYKAKYEDIRLMLDILQKKNEQTAQETEYEIDTEKRYVFAMDNWTSYMKEIKAVFPNAEFIGENTNLESKKIDMVILMPGHLGHPTYYSIKKQCKDKNIKFIHCNKTNISEIKKVIALAQI